MRICRRGVVVKEFGSGGVIGPWMETYAGVDRIDAIDSMPCLGMISEKDVQND